MRAIPPPFRSRLAPLLLACLGLAGCLGRAARPPTPTAAPLPTVTVPPPKIGLALGGGAARGFAHIGVIKMLEASGIHIDVVAGTSAGSVVGALYAGGMDPFALQQAAFGLDEAKIRDVRLFSGGLVQGQALQDYVDQWLRHRPIEKLQRPFAAVATELESGQRTVFVRGDAGQAVRASCSIPGVFEPAPVGDRHYVDGGVTSPVPVDAARQLGADFVIAVDISRRTGGGKPQGMLDVLDRSIGIMGRKLGEQETQRADVVIHPQVDDVGAADFEMKNQAILEGEKAALAAIPDIRAKLAALEAQRQETATLAAKGLR